MKFYFNTLLLFFLLGCSSAPTKIYATHTSALAKGTLIIDARPAFEYSVSHLSGSLNMHGEDFSQREEPYKGLLEQDLYFHARRLARYGISPETPIVVVGRGLHGNGEEGRLAWTLLVLGIKNVRFSTVDAFTDSFAVPLSHEATPPRISEAIWKPVIDESLTVDNKEFLNNIGKAVVIDVRSEAEYLGKDTHSYYSKMAPDVSAINIPWKEFLNSKGKPNPDIKVKLEQVGITADKTIYVVSEKGIRSAAVTLVLRALGFSKSANFAGGYMELVGQ